VYGNSDAGERLDTAAIVCIHSYAWLRREPTLSRGEGKAETNSVPRMIPAGRIGRC
jgi:hypothetical protein